MPDNIVVIGGQPAEVVGFSDDSVAYRIYEQVDNHNHSPLHSGQLYIFLVERLCNFIQYAPLANVQCKCVLFNVSGETVVMPLLHTFAE